mmetsp:Transcript_17386/g.56903  ORF Transcript_17386/g.56903 Transcript_17386/m.56903 type:complete len:269 (-) Transcript_17386:648-1454(-)
MAMQNGALPAHPPLLVCLCFGTGLADIQALKNFACGSIHQPARPLGTSIAWAVLEPQPVGRCLGITKVRSQCHVHQRDGVRARSSKRDLRNRSRRHFSYRCDGRTVELGLKASRACAAVARMPSPSSGRREVDGLARRPVCIVLSAALRGVSRGCPGSLAQPVLPLRQDEALRPHKLVKCLIAGSYVLVGAMRRTTEIDTVQAEGFAHRVGGRGAAAARAIPNTTPDNRGFTAASGMTVLLGLAAAREGACKCFPCAGEVRERPPRRC